VPGVHQDAGLSAEEAAQYLVRHQSRDVLRVVQNALGAVHDARLGAGADDRFRQQHLGLQEPVREIADVAAERLACHVLAFLYAAQLQSLLRDVEAQSTRVAAPSAARSAFAAGELAPSAVQGRAVLRPSLQLQVQARRLPGFAHQPSRVQLAEQEIELLPELQQASLQPQRWVVQLVLVPSRSAARARLKSGQLRAATGQPAASAE